MQSRGDAEAWWNLDKVYSVLIQNRWSEACYHGCRHSWLVNLWRCTAMTMGKRRTQRRLHTHFVSENMVVNPVSQNCRSQNRFKMQGHHTTRILTSRAECVCSIFHMCVHLMTLTALCLPSKQIHIKSWTGLYKRNQWRQKDVSWKLCKNVGHWVKIRWRPWDRVRGSWGSSGSIDKLLTATDILELSNNMIFLVVRQFLSTAVSMGTNKHPHSVIQALFLLVGCQQGKQRRSWQHQWLSEMIHALVVLTHTSQSELQSSDFHLYQNCFLSSLFNWSRFVRTGLLLTYNY